MVDVLGSFECSDLRGILSKTTISSRELSSTSKLSSSGNKLLLVLFHGGWNGYKAPSKDLLFLNQLSNEIKEDNLKHIKSNSIVKLMHHHTIMDDTNNIQLASAMISDVISKNSNNDEEHENLLFCIHELKVPSTLPTLALIFLPKDDNRDYVIKYIQINSMLLHAYIAGINKSDNFHKDTNRNAMPEIIQGIKDALIECINDNRKRELITEGDDSNNSKKVKHGSNDDPMEIDNENNKGQEHQIRIFISGDRSQVGKSSICLGLLGSLLKLGYKSSDLAYIKPATQCENPTLVSKFCNANNISCQPIGPLVYFKGYTREFLSGNTNTSEELLNQITNAVDDVGRDKKIVIIDGVGYPAVGSICGTDNATIASRCGITTSKDKKRLPALVLIVGKSGVGDAIDSFNLNRTYFEHKNVPILGAIFNRFSLDGYYSMDNCQREISKYFTMNNITKYHPFGFIPESPSLIKLKEQESKSDTDTSFTITAANEFISTFQKHVNVESILKEARSLTTKLIFLHLCNDMEIEALENNEKANKHVLDQKSSTPTVKTTSTSINRKNVILTREQIEKAAKEAGAVAKGA